MHRFLLYTDEYVRKRWTEMTDPIERSIFAEDVAQSWHDYIADTVAEEHPDWSAADKAVEIFLRKYRDDFTAEQIEQISQNIRRQHEQKK